MKEILADGTAVEDLFRTGVADEDEKLSALMVDGGLIALRRKRDRRCCPATDKTGARSSSMSAATKVRDGFPLTMTARRKPYPWNRPRGACRRDAG